MICIAEMARYTVSLLTVPVVLLEIVMLCALSAAVVDVLPC